MYFADARNGKEYSKDPAVVRFQGKYFLYYSMPPKDWGNGAMSGWSIGIAQSDDLEHWNPIGRLVPEFEYEQKGLCAPGAIVLKGKVYLFYQTYGNFPHDAICCAVSEDGIHFQKHPENPIFSPHGDWNNGRAIDADVIPWKDQLMLYFASRDPEGKIQLLGVASAPLDSDYGRNSWKQRCTQPILKPELPWEQQCIEAPAVCHYEGKLYLFYGGAYNVSPQQIGCAVSDDGIHWKRLSQTPILSNGQPGDWNYSESGHPFVFQDEDGSYYLFYQGNCDGGETWYLSYRKLHFENGIPVLGIDTVPDTKNTVR